MDTKEERRAKKLECSRLWRERNPEYMRTYYYRTRDKRRSLKARAAQQVAAKAKLEATLAELEAHLQKLRERLAYGPGAVPGP